MQGTWSLLPGQALLVTVETIYRKNDKIEVEINMGNGGMSVDGNIGWVELNFRKNKKLREKARVKLKYFAEYHFYMNQQFWGNCSNRQKLFLIEEKLSIAFRRANFLLHQAAKREG